MLPLLNLDLLGRKLSTTSSVVLTVWCGIGSPFGPNKFRLQLSSSPWKCISYQGGQRPSGGQPGHVYLTRQFLGTKSTTMQGLTRHLRIISPSASCGNAHRCGDLRQAGSVPTPFGLPGPSLAVKICSLPPGTPVRRSVQDG